MSSVASILGRIGAFVLHVSHEVGTYLILSAKTIYSLRKVLREIHNVFVQMETIGVNSLPVVLVTSLFTGMVLAVQMYTGFARFNAQTLVGTVVALAMCRELGPVLTAFIVSGRAGSSMAAELGTMRVTEQIDALYTLSADPVEFLILPRFVSSIIMLPVLTLIGDLVGIMGGYYVTVTVLGENGAIYMDKTFNYLYVSDITSGLVKAAVFGAIIAIVSCKEGFFTSGGAKGVGRATTKSVVIAYMAILVSDYFLTTMMY